MAADAHHCYTRHGPFDTAMLLAETWCWHHILMPAHLGIAVAQAEPHEDARVTSYADSFNIGFWDGGIMICVHTAKQ